MSRASTSMWRMADTFALCYLPCVPFAASVCAVAGRYTTVGRTRKGHSSAQRRREEDTRNVMPSPPCCVASGMNVLGYAQWSPRRGQWAAGASEEERKGNGGTGRSAAHRKGQRCMHATCAVRDMETCGCDRSGESGCDARRRCPAPLRLNGTNEERKGRGRSRRKKETTVCWMWME
jgi:hypothetical protein